MCSTQDEGQVVCKQFSPANGVKEKLEEQLAHFEAKSQCFDLLKCPNVMTLDFKKFMI